MSDITLQEYQRFTHGKALYEEEVFINTKGTDEHGAWTDHEDMSYMYPVLALAEEAGEVAGKVAKYVRKGGGNYAQLRKDVLPELGDVAYALSEAARQFGYTLNDVLCFNITKLDDRAVRGVLQGEGDLR